MSEAVPDYLFSTWSMLSGAYPNGIPGEERYAVIRVLLERLSFHSICEVLRLVNGTGDGYYNDVLGVEGNEIAIPSALQLRVEETLGQHGLVKWRAEAD